MDEIPKETADELRALPLERGRPLIAVDADEVLVIFVAHLQRYIRTLGFEMRLVRYELEGSMFPIGSDAPLPFRECIDLIRQFFAAECTRQEAVPGAAETLARLEDIAQIIVLTNVPRSAVAARRENLDGLGIPYPMVANTGGKGPCLRWLADQVEAPVIFVDDSVKQIESAERHAEDVLRLHFAWADFIQRIFPTCPSASTQVRDWARAEREIRAHLGG